MIKKTLKKIVSFFVILKLKLSFKNISVKFSSFIHFSTKFGGNNRVGAKCKISGEIGRYSYIGERCDLRKVKIGNFCSIAPGVKLLAATHPTHSFVSSSPAFYSKDNQCGASFSNEEKFKQTLSVPNNDNYHCIIANDVWIGEDAKIIGGVTIGNGAIIGAGAVVTKDIEPFSIVAGVPAVKKSDRFPEEIKSAIEKSQWWNWSDKKLKDNVDLFSDPKKFCQFLEKEGKN